MSQEIISEGVEAEGSWAHPPALAPHVAGEAGRTYQSFSEKAESWLWCTIACKDAEEGGKGQLQTPLSLLCRDLLLTFLRKTVSKAGEKMGCRSNLPLRPLLHHSFFLTLFAIPPFREPALHGPGMTGKDTLVLAARGAGHPD